MREVRWLCISFLLSGALHAAEIQGVVADWKCTESMVRHGREQILKQDSSCSLVKNSDRDEYGLISDTKHFFRLDAEGNKRVKLLLHDSHDKDNLKVIVTGTLEGNLIKVTYASIL